MNRRRTLTGLVAVACAATASLALSPPASADPRGLIDAPLTSVALDTPAPGESRTWTMSVTSTSNEPVRLDLRIGGESDRLFTGPHPLQITITEAGRTVLEPTDVGEVVGTSLRLTDLSAGADRELVGTVTLPRAAGNEYQGAGGELRFQFLAQAGAPATTPGTVPAPTAPAPAAPAPAAPAPTFPALTVPALARTGPALAGAATVLAIVSITFGVAILRRRRKTENHA